MFRVKRNRGRVKNIIFFMVSGLCAMLYLTVQE
jgi:hypothetical protein